MSEMLIRIPEELKGLGEALQEILSRVQEKVSATGGGRAIDYRHLPRNTAGTATAVLAASALFSAPAGG